MATEVFNKDAVKAKMSDLESVFKDFASLLEQMNNEVNLAINISPDSAMFGERAFRFLKTWDENASTFGDFYKNFNSWSEMVAAVAANNDNLEFQAFRTIGSDLDGIQEARKTKAESNGVENYVADSSREISDDGKILRSVKSIDGSVTQYEMGKNGTINSHTKVLPDGTVEKGSYENGKIVGYKLTDKDGKVLKTYDANHVEIKSENTSTAEEQKKEENNTEKTNTEQNNTEKNTEDRSSAAISCKHGEKVNIKNVEYTYQGVTNDSNKVIVLKDKEGKLYSYNSSDGTVDKIMRTSKYYDADQATSSNWSDSFYEVKIGDYDMARRGLNTTYDAVFENK